MTFPVKWCRQNHIGNLPKESASLVRGYAKLMENTDDESDEYSLSDAAILKRAQQIAAAASTSTEKNDSDGKKDGSSLVITAAEYRCFETGGFLLPSVSQHPWYRSKDQKNELLTPGGTSGNNDRTTKTVLDLGCGLAGDARQMLVDGFATNVVGVDRSELYLRLGCELFGDDPRKTIVRTFSKDERVDVAVETDRGFFQSRMKLLPLDVTDEEDRSSFLAIISRALESQHGTQQTSIEDEHENSAAPYFDGVYAGKFLHCLETEENFQILLRLLRKVLVPGGVFFGVFGRNYVPAWECRQRDDFERVLVSEGFSVGMVLEEAAGATWFSSCVEPAS